MSQSKQNKTEKPKINDYKMRKELASRQRKLKTAVSRLESSIEDIEEEIALIEEKLNSNPPYEQFLAINEELQKKTKIRDSLLEEWMEKSEELTSISD